MTPPIDRPSPARRRLMMPRLVFASLMPFVTGVVQWYLWPWIQPFVWFLFFPTVFFSARVGGFRGGVASTLVSTLIVWYVFLPPQLSWKLAVTGHLWSVALFLAVGYLVSEAQGRLERALRRTEEALDGTRQANEELSRLYEKTRELDELKTRFFANVSHELRTPLTLILNPVSVHRATPGLDPKLARDLEVVERNARLLYRHVTDLLDVARFQAGRMVPHRVPADLAGMARTVASHFEIAARERRIALEVIGPESLPANVDVEMLQRVFLNLISNALKFTPDGGAVQVALQGSDASVVIRVRDTGPGVPVSEQERIFEPFQQADSGTDRRFTGTGLGLAIVRQFVDLHGGVVSAREAPGGGALFEVRLPAGVPDAPGGAAATVRGMDPVLSRQAQEMVRPGATARPEMAAAPDAPLVLIVEDNADMSAYLGEVLGGGGRRRVAFAADGRQGLERACALQPDLIVTDLMMPDMNGADMAMALRAQAGFSEIPIVVLTAKVDDVLRIALLRAGVQDYLAKPFDAAELEARVDRLLTERRRAGRRLQESERRFEATFELAAVGLALVAPDGSWLRVNRKLCEIVGYDREALLSLSFQDITHPDDLASDLDLVGQMLAGKIGTYSLEKRYIRGDGEVVWINLTVALSRRAGGEPDYFISVVEDIQTRKRAEAALRESETRFRQIFENVATGIVITDPDGRYEQSNPAFSALIGYPEHALRGMNRTMLIHPEDLAENTAGIRRLLSGELTAFQTENRFVHRDGHAVWVRKIVSTLPGEDGTPSHVIALVTDVTESRRAQAALLESEARFRRLFELAPIAMGLVSHDDRIVALNARFIETLGYTRDDIPTLAVWREKAYPDRSYRHSVTATWMAAIGRTDREGLAVESIERRMVARDGSIRHVIASTIPLPEGILFALHDVTAMRAAEEGLRASRARLQAFIRYAPISIALFDRHMNYLATSGRWLEEFGRGHADLVGLNHYDVLPDLPEAWKEVHRQGLAGASLKNDDDVWDLADGGRIWLRWAVLPWIDEHGAIGGIIISTENISDRKQAEAAARESGERLEGIVNSAMDAIISVDAEQCIRLFNPAAGQIFGVDPAAAIGTSLTRFIPARFRGRHGDHVRDFAATGSTARRMGALGEVSGLRANGEEFPLEASISKTTVSEGGLYTVILRDISERRRADAVLRELRREMEQMHALQVASQTAAAIAHELNQPLNAVASYSEAALRLLRAGNPRPERLLHALGRSAEQAQRAGRVMRELIDFLHKGEMPVEEVDLRSAVRRAIAVSEGSAAPDIAVRVDATHRLRNVRGNRVRIEKVLVNLLRNAAEAMEAAGTSHREIVIDLSAEDERMARVSVRDTGPGLTEEMAVRIFDPFYTTKAGGVGMGLAICRSLIESQGGQLWVDRSGDRGVAFLFTLPFAE